MKRLICLFLCLLLLCGCGPAPEPTVADTAPIETVAPPTQPVESREPLLYRVLDGYIQGILPMGENLLVVSVEDGSTLTLLRGEDLSIMAQTKLSCLPYPQDPCFRVWEAGVTYFDENSRELVTLGADLTEQERLPMPEDMLGIPAAGEEIFYVVSGALWALDPKTGMDRLVKEFTFPSVTLTAIHCDGAVLECHAEHEDGTWSQMFLSTIDGALLYELYDSVSLQTYCDRYFALHMDGMYEEKLLGQVSLGMQDLNMLHCPDPNATAYPMLSRDAVLTATVTDTATVLDCYNITYGSHPYSITLEGYEPPWQAVEDPTGRYIWLAFYDYLQDTYSLLRWEPELSPVQDDTAYIGTRRTAENPDTFGLGKISDEARALSEKHGVSILTWTDATEMPPFDYQLIPEHQVSILRQGLAALDDALSHFPEGMLSQAAENMGNGVLKIRLVRALWGNPEYDTLDSASGIQFWDDEGGTNIALAMESDMEKNLYHELYHVLESRIYANSDAFDNWDELNPSGFSYDYNYSDYIYRDDYSLTAGDTQAFIDFYSMSYPKEDRARLLENAMIPENGYCFESKIMQAKLRTLCRGIREAYGLEDYQGELLWEQYLDK